MNREQREYAWVYNTFGMCFGSPDKIARFTREESLAALSAIFDSTEHLDVKDFESLERTTVAKWYDEEKI